MAEAWRETDKLFYARGFNDLDWFAERQQLVSKTKKADMEAARTEVSATLAKLGDRYTRYVAPDKYAQLVAATLGDAAFVAGAGVARSPAKKEIFARATRERRGVCVRARACARVCACVSVCVRACVRECVCVSDRERRRLQTVCASQVLADDAIAGVVRQPR